MAYGFKPLRMLNGTPYTGALAKRNLTAAAVAYAKGDPLEIDADGTLSLAEASDTLIVGVLQYMEWTDASGNFHQDTYIAATTGLTVTAYYVPVENVVFRVCADDMVAAAAATNEGSNANFYVGTASSVTKLSGVELDSDSISTTSTLPLKILGLYPKPGAAYGSIVTVQGSGVVELEVIFNAHWTHPGTTSL